MDMAGIMARLERLEADNESLRQEVRRLQPDDPALGSAAAVPTPIAVVSRRQLLRRAGVTAIGVGVAAASAATLGGSEAVRADGESIIIGAANDTALNTQSLENKQNDETVFRAVSDGSGTGLSGSSITGNGTVGLSQHGVGVVGVGGRGGAFIGTKAVINLNPAPTAGHPSRGVQGDIVLDRTFRLWVCKGGPHWKQLG